MLKKKKKKLHLLKFKDLKFGGGVKKAFIVALSFNSKLDFPDSRNVYYWL